MLNSMTQRMASASATIHPSEPACAFHYDTHTFDTMANLQREFFADMKRRHGSNLFTTDAHVAEPLADVFLNHLPDEVRQDHTCNCCRGFLKRYGGLAVIDDNGVVRSALWGFGGYPRVYAAAISTLLMRVERSNPTGVFLHDEPLIARPHDGSRTHFGLQHDNLFHHDIMTKAQAMAAKREDHKTLKRALEEYPRADCNRALTLLAADALYRGEQHVAPVRFLIETHDAVARVHPGRRDAILWQAVAEAPAGFCSPRGTMVGTLIEDIQGGLPDHDIKARFASKKDPTKYKRPQAAPAAGNIAQAEKAIEKLDLATAMRRRFARRDEVKAIWRSQHKNPAVVQTGVFVGVAIKGEATRRVPLGHPVESGPITWAKFQRDVMPSALAIEVWVPQVCSLTSILTSQDPEAKPIMRWDRADRRNPFSWFVYAGHRDSEDWGIKPGWNRVDMISDSPAVWGIPVPYCEYNVMPILYIPGAYDRRPSLDMMLFPEVLRSALHPYRASIEAYSRANKMEPPNSESACGVVINPKSQTKVRVTTDHGIITYTIDRME